MATHRGVFALLILCTVPPALHAQEHEFSLPPGAAEALRANGSILDGSLIEELASQATSEQTDADKRRFLLAERLLRTARQLESEFVDIPEANGLPKRLRLVALRLLSSALGSSGPSAPAPTKTAPLGSVHPKTPGRPILGEEEEPLLGLPSTAPPSDQPALDESPLHQVPSLQ